MFLVSEHMIKIVCVVLRASHLRVFLEEVADLLNQSLLIVLAQSQRIHRFLDEFTLHCRRYRLTWIHHTL